MQSEGMGEKNLAISSVFSDLTFSHSPAPLYACACSSDKYNTLQHFQGRMSTPRATNSLNYDTLPMIEEGGNHAHGTYQPNCENHDMSWTSLQGVLTLDQEDMGCRLAMVFLNWIFCLWLLKCLRVVRRCHVWERVVKMTFAVRKGKVYHGEQLKFSLIQTLLF